MVETPRVSAVVGRTPELAAVEQLLGSARERFSALVLEGEAGIGKTTVWRAGVEQAVAKGFAVASCRPAEAETKLAFSGLTDLLQHVMEDVLEALPDPQRRSLEVALLQSEADGPVEQRVVATAVRSTLLEWARRQPLLIAIDDLQWLDAASAEILGFVLRRLEREPIGLLASRRIGLRSRVRLDDLAPETLTTISVGPLSVAAVHQLLKARLGEAPARQVLVRIHEATEGNPFFAVEIGRLLQELGPLPPGAPLPIPSVVEDVVADRLERLPEATRQVLLVAAALGDPRTEVTEAAVGRPIEGDLETASRSAVAVVDDERVRFEHPLFGAAVYSAAPAGERRRLHRTLAELVDDDEERARHLALAASGRDEEAARAAHAAARRIALRGAPAAAVELAELALVLGEPGASGEPQRLFDLADYLYRAGENERARTVLDGIVDWSAWPPELRGDALELRIEVWYWLEGPTDALVRVGDEVLRGDLPPAVRAQVLTILGEKYEHDLRRASGLIDEALAALDRLGDAADPRVRAAALTTQIRNRLVLGEGLDRTQLDAVRALEARIPPDRRPPVPSSDFFGQWLKYVDDVDGSIVLLEEGLGRNLAAGSEWGVLNKLQHLALAHCLRGEFETARGRAIEAWEIYDSLRTNVIGYAPAILAIVEAHAGNVEAVRSIEERHRAVGAGDVIHLRVASGLLELSLGNDAGALEQLTVALEAIASMGHLEPGIHRVHGNAAEAALGVGDVERADALASFLERHAERTSHRWSRVVAARTRALLAAGRGDLDEAAAAAEAALTAGESLGMPFERGRTLLVKGIVARRARRRTLAHEALAAAAAEFDRISARIWAERARGELERVGLRRAPDALTPSERRVAELAARGMTNREVAAALFMSPKTVEANLARVYRKLEIGSRAELGARMAELLQT
jgi:DNA-binding CsgD family transcriptional regulator